MKITIKINEKVKCEVESNVDTSVFDCEDVVKIHDSLCHVAASVYKENNNTTNNYHYN